MLSPWSPDLGSYQLSTWMRYDVDRILLVSVVFRFFLAVIGGMLCVWSVSSFNVLSGFPIYTLSPSWTEWLLKTEETHMSILLCHHRPVSCFGNTVLQALVEEAQVVRPTVLSVSQVEQKSNVWRVITDKHSIRLLFWSIILNIESIHVLRSIFFFVCENYCFDQYIIKYYLQIYFRYFIKHFIYKKIVFARFN